MKKMSLLTVLVAAVALTAYSVSGTYAKYTSTFEGTDSARVAKWAFSVGDKNTSTDNEFTFDLFKGYIAETGEANVKDGGETETIIAPGTKGSFEISLANNSEVNAKYSIVYNVTKTADIPVQFRVYDVDNGDEDGWTDDLTTLNVTDEAIAMNNATDTVKIEWRWVFEKTTTNDEGATVVDAANDKADTDLGLVGTDTITVTATVTAVQVD